MSESTVKPWAALFGLAIVLVFGVLLSQLHVGPSGALEVNHAEPAAPLPGLFEAADPPGAVSATMLERLPCFECHSLSHYLEGAPPGPADEATETDDEGPPSGPFSHALHADEEVGHCHMCHAFTGHFQVVTRQETCAECH